MLRPGSRHAGRRRVRGGSEVRRESGVRRLAREGEKDVLVKDISDTFTRRLASQLSPTWDLSPTELDSPGRSPSVTCPPTNTSCLVSGSASSVTPGSSCKHQAVLQKLVPETPQTRPERKEKHPARPLPSGCRGTHRPRPLSVKIKGTLRSFMMCSKSLR